MTWLEALAEALEKGWSLRADHIAKALHHLLHKDKELEERVKKLEECAAKVCPKVVSLTVEISSVGANDMTLTAVATWSDGFTGFDTTNHLQPSDWPANVVYTLTSGDASLTDHHDDTASVTAGAQASVVHCAYDAFSADVDISAAPPTIAGISVNQS